MLTNSRNLTKIEHQGLAVAECMRGYIPKQVLQPTSRHTYNTAENQFIRASFIALQQACSSIEEQPWWCNIPEEIQHNIRDLSWLLHDALNHSLFDEVGEMVIFPYTSQVLLRRDGYREFLQLWRLFQLGYLPFFTDLQEAIALRDIATLYEYWCFFELGKRLESIFDGRIQATITVLDDEGLEYEATMSWDNGAELVFNRTFSRRKRDSYSVSLRPDFTLYMRKPDGDVDLIIFDAKFRFDFDEWQFEDSKTRERKYKRADIYKMHTYRDALDAQVAVVLYPGDVSTVYLQDTQIVDRDSTLFSILSSVGVGALEFKPTKEQKI